MSTKIGGNSVAAGNEVANDVFMDCMERMIGLRDCEGG